MSKILVIGDIYFENQFFVDEIPSENEFRFSKSLLSRVGSKTLNSARTMLKLGNDVDYFAKIGSDDISDQVLQKLDEYGIKTSLIKVVPNTKTGMIIIQTNNLGKNSMVLFSGANSGNQNNDLLRIRKIISDYDFVYTYTNISSEYLYEIVEIANKTGKSIFIDFPNRHKEIDLNKISSADWIMPNRQETEKILEIEIKSLEDAKKAILDLRKSLKRNILITLDSDGALVLEAKDTDPVYYPAKKVKAIDSIGAGDIFRGIFASEVGKGKDVDKAIKLAGEISSEVIKYKGLDSKIEHLIDK